MGGLFGGGGGSKSPPKSGGTPAEPPASGTAPRAGAPEYQWPSGRATPLKKERAAFGNASAPAEDGSLGD